MQLHMSSCSKWVLVCAVTYWVGFMLCQPGAEIGRSVPIPTSEDLWSKIRDLALMMAYSEINVIFQRFLAAPTHCMHPAKITSQLRYCGCLVYFAFEIIVSNSCRASIYMWGLPMAISIVFLYIDMYSSSNLIRNQISQVLLWRYMLWCMDKDSTATQTHTNSQKNRQADTIP